MTEFNLSTIEANIESNSDRDNIGIDARSSPVAGLNTSNVLFEIRTLMVD